MLDAANLFTSPGLFGSNFPTSQDCQVIFGEFWFGPRSVKEESMFYELGYLAAPNPPDEIERRRALYRYVHVAVHPTQKWTNSYLALRFNIWNTGPDPSFQRIAYLVKLVFNTKIVVISLIDENEE
jgi:hypothetical protein